MTPTQPTMILVGGPNGAGKTTFAMQRCAETGFSYLGADAIAARMNPENPAAVQIAAGEAFIRTLRDWIQTGRSCVVESTLSGRTLVKDIHTAVAHGYQTGLIFVFVTNAATSINRVAARVRRGGHHVPTDDVHRRFGRSLRNFWDIYRPAVDRWEILYNGSQGIVTVSTGESDDTVIVNPELFELFQTLKAE